MRHVDVPPEPSSDARLADVASILAAGILRLRKQKRRHDFGPCPGSDSFPTCLEVPSETVLSVPHG